MGFNRRKKFLSGVFCQNAMGKWAEKKIIDKREKAAYNENNKGISKPMTEKSIWNLSFSENTAAVRAVQGNSGEWTHEGGKKGLKLSNA